MNMILNTPLKKKRITLSDRAQLSPRNEFINYNNI